MIWDKNEETRFVSL